MDVSDLDIDSLYELYEKHFQVLSDDVVKAKRSRGSADPPSLLKLLSRTDFETALCSPSPNKEVAERWVSAILRANNKDLGGSKVA